MLSGPSMAAYQSDLFFPLCVIYLFRKLRVNLLILNEEPHQNLDSNTTTLPVKQCTPYCEVMHFRNRADDLSNKTFQRQKMRILKWKLNLNNKKNGKKNLGIRKQIEVVG